jgi:hypothetical protein
MTHCLLGLSSRERKPLIAALAAYDPFILHMLADRETHACAM